MKRFLSIAFIAILLLNLTGYHIVFIGLQYQNDITMIKVLDENQHDLTQTFTVKVPLPIPYMSDRSDYERIDGKFEHQGEYYRMVKQRFDKDTLTVVCVKDRESERITEALSSYLKTFTEPSGARFKVTLCFIKDYLSEYFSLMSISTGWRINVGRYHGCPELTSTYIFSLTHPPELS